MTIFKQGTGQLRDAQTYRLIDTGYAGRDAGKNNPAMENVKGVGPLPCGNYTGVELRDPHQTVGSYAIRLEPDNETRARIVAYGRNPDSFFMHGDSREHPGLASHGCIVMPRPTREWFWMKTDRRVEVVS